METSAPYLALPDRLVGDRIVVRPFQVGDGQALFEAIEESRDHLLPWLPWGAAETSPAISEEKARQMRQTWDSREDLPLGIWDLHESRLLGGTGLHRFDLRLGSFEIGYWIRRSERGHGYVTEAVRLLADLVFGPLNGNRVMIRCATMNHRSSAIPKKLGFVFEGVMRNTSMSADGSLQDLEIYSLIPADYARLRPTWQSS